MKPILALLALILVAIAPIASAGDQQIAYVKGQDIYIAYLDGSDPLRVTDDPECPKGQLVWSFDGERLAYVRTREEERIVISDIYMISVSVPEPRLVVDGARLEAPGNAIDYTGAWSPAFGHGGQFLYFVSGGGTEGGFLSRVDLTAKEFPAAPERVETNRTFESFAIAADGQAAGSYRPYYPQGGHHHEVCVAPRGEWREFVDISEPTGFDDAGDDYIAPAWSPDGKTVAAIHAPRDDICLFDVVGGTSRLFLDGDVMDRLDISEVTWRPDGKGVYFVVRDRKTRKPHSMWYAPLADAYDRELIGMGIDQVAAGGSVKLRGL